MTDVKTAIALRSDQEEFDDTQLAVLRQLGVSGSTRADNAVYFHQCKRTGLDPFARQIYMIKRMVWNPDTQQKEPRQTIQTGIDGFRLIARRACKAEGESLEYEDTQFCGPDGQWVDVWLDEDNPPKAAKVTVLRNGKRFPAVALFREYAATKMVRGKNGEPDRLVLTGQWVDKPAIMIAKCAEALALRKAFPQDLSGLYTDDELDSQPTVDVVVTRVVDQPVDTEAEPVDPDADGEPQPDGTPDIPAEVELSWDDAIANAQTIDELNDIWARIGKAKARTPALTRVFSAKGKELAAASADKATA